MIMYKPIAISVALTVLTSCGGGSGGGNPETGSIANIDPGFCSVQSDYFSELAGTRTGLLREAVLATDAIDSFCEFDVELVFNNDPKPTRNCEITGQLSYVGTQLVVDAGNTVSCESASDVMIRISQSVAVVQVNPTPIEPPLDILLFVEAPNPVDTGVRVPFINRQVVSVNQDYSIQINDDQLLSAE